MRVLARVQKERDEARECVASSPLLPLETILTDSFAFRVPTEPLRISRIHWAVVVTRSDSRQTTGYCPGNFGGSQIPFYVDFFLFPWLLRKRVQACIRVPIDPFKDDTM